MPNQFHMIQRTASHTTQDLADSVMPDQQPEWHNYESLYQGRKMPLQDNSCLEYFDEVVAQAPEAPALSMCDQTLNYAEIAFSINALAYWFLEEANVNPGDRVALYLPSNLSYMIAVFAAWRARLVVTNLSFILENSYILHQLQDSGAKILVTIPAFLPQVEKILLQTSIRHIVTTQADDYNHFLGRIKNWLSPRKWLEQWREDTTMIRYIRLRHILKKHRSVHCEWPSADLDDVAMIQYTSGTTDTPKGVALTHRNLSANYQQTRQILNDHLTADKCGLCTIPLQHIVGVSFCLMMLCTGAHVVLTTRSELLFRSKSLQQYPLDIMAGVPYLYHQVLKQDAAMHLVKKMELFLCGGSLVSRTLQQQWQELTGRHLCEAFGLSETASLISINPPQRIRVGTVGVVLPNTEICIVGNRQQPLGFNQPGELWVRGSQVMRGYWHKPDFTQQVMTYDNWFKTGDIVSISEDGFITMLERQSDTLWWQNQQMFPQEIEHRICQHEDVIDCVMLQDESHCQSPIRLLVVVKKDLSPDRLIGYIRDQLHFGVVPDVIEFVDHLPRGPMGRVFRRLMRKPASTGTRSEQIDRPS
ncbi:AMP-binding protein [Alkanindiges sp. WGS2144]|uniref:AMP-binding protein n=1 Tax=Alkanindiges sp. WGS2144 TaxID=3366808 RepID=UPI00375336B8